MTAVAESWKELADTTQVKPRVLHWTVDRYRKAIQNGVFGEDERLELLFGGIYERMGANPPHAACIELLQEYFTERYFKKYGLRSENAVQLSDESLPQPDFVVVAYRSDHYAKNFPQITDVFVLIEVADSSLLVDRGKKKTAYALAGIPEYWIVNLKERQLELHLQPDRVQGLYRSVVMYAEDSKATSPFVGEVVVADILPSVDPE